MTNKIQVIIADDSGLMRLIISDILNADPDIKVIDSAKNGKEATEKTLALNPDVLVLDMHMEEYDGLYAVKNILAEKKIPILILSAVGNTNMEPIIEAIKLGAFDYLNKPDKNKAKLRDIGDEIIAKVKAAANAKRSSSPLSTNKGNENTHTHTFSKTLDYDIIAIGSSTGGPSAIEAIVTQLPGNLPIPVVIAQHMPANFIESFTKRLDSISPLTVVVAKKDEALKPGYIYMAPGDHNLVVRKSISGKISFDYDDLTKYRDFNNPSINALFHSVAKNYGKRCIAAILTGMGKDGAEGMEEIHRQGGYTLAQNKETCVVFGMPREVIERKAARSVISINDMAPFMVSCLS